MKEHNNGPLWCLILVVYGISMFFWGYKDGKESMCKSNKLKGIAMTKKVAYGCDACGKPIEEGHQELFMATITIDCTVHCDDGSAAGTEEQQDVFHVHNDLSKHCLRKIWKLLLPKEAREVKEDAEDKSSKQT